jgi:outer membrane autotransporter protein
MFKRLRQVAALFVLLFIFDGVVAAQTRPICELTLTPPTGLNLSALPTPGRLAIGVSLTCDSVPIGNSDPYTWALSPTTGFAGKVAGLLPDTAALTDAPAGTYTINAYRCTTSNPCTSFIGTDVVASRSFTLVAATNTPPTISLDVGTPRARVGRAIRFLSVTADADNDPLTIEYLSNGNVFRTLTNQAPGNRNEDFSCTAPGAFAITARVDDGRGGRATAPQTLSLTCDANQAPTISGLSVDTRGVATLREPATVDINASVRDGDGDIRFTEFTVLRDGIAYGTNPRSVNNTGGPDIATPVLALTGLPVGNYEVTAVAADDLGARSAVSDPIRFTVEAVPAAVVCSASATPARSQIGSTQVTLSANCTSNGQPVNDVPPPNSGQTITYEWVRVSAPQGAQPAPSYASNTTRTLVIPASGFDATGLYIFGVTRTVTEVLSERLAKSKQAQRKSTTISNQAQVSVTIEPRPASVLRCTGSVDPLNAQLTDVVRIAVAGCTLNGVALSSNQEGELAYRWTKETNAPAIPGDATSKTLTFPSGTFLAPGTYSYIAEIRLFSRSLFVASDSVRVVVAVVPPSVSSVVVTNLSSIFVSPGASVVARLKATDATGKAVGKVVLSASIESAANANASKSQPGDRKACVANDSLPATVTTNETTGEADLSITFGCGVGSRKLKISATGLAKPFEFTLTGANTLVTAVSFTAGARLLAVTTAAQTSLSARAVDGNKAAIEGAFVTWEATPANAATVTPDLTPSVTDKNGNVSAKVQLAGSARKATIRVCVDNRGALLCDTIDLVSQADAVERPAQAITAPMVQQSIAAPRVQISNVSSRLSQLRTEQLSGWYADVGLNVPGGRIPIPGSGSSSTSSSDEGEKSDSSKQKDGSAAGTRASRLGVFFTGDIDISRRGASAIDGGDTTLKRGSSSIDGGYKINTKGLTLGVDYRLHKDWVIGAALGGLRSETDIGAIDAVYGPGDQTAKGYSGSLFAQWLPAQRLYVNGVLNVGRNEYDNRRLVNNVALQGSTKGSQVAGQVEAGYFLNANQLRLTPFLRYEFVQATIDPLKESGSDDAVMIETQKVRAASMNLGVSLDYTLSTSVGVLIPTARVEYGRQSQRQDAVFARLVNGTPVLAPIAQAAVDRYSGNYGIGIQWLTGISAQPISVYLGYERAFGNENSKSDRYLLGIKLPL